MNSTSGLTLLEKESLEMLSNGPIVQLESGSHSVLCLNDNFNEGEGHTGAAATMAFNPTEICTPSRIFPIGSAGSAVIHLHGQRPA